MKQIFKTEMKRAMSGKGMVLSILIGTVLGIAHVIREIIPAYRANLTNFYNEFPILSPHSAVETWMAGSPSNLEGFIFFLILPILASLPFGTSYFEDCKEGVIKNIYMRTKREDYLKAKYAAAFLSGGIAVLVPLIFNLMCSLVLLPNLAPLSTMGDNILTPLMLFYKIFFAHPMIYTTFFLVVQFLMAGIWACVCLSVSFLSDYKIVVLIFPFFVQLILHVICTITNHIDYSSVYWVQPGHGIVAWWIPVVSMGIGIPVTFFVFMKKGAKEDVF